MSVSVVTFGCRLNAYESEIMRAHAEAAGRSSLVIVNTCAVTLEAERQARQTIRRIHREQPDAAIVVAGCAATLAPARWAALPGVARVLTNEEKLAPESWGRRDPVLPNFAGRARAFVPVQQGCDHRCTFCIIPYARGPSRSRPPAEIIAEVRALLAKGFSEIVLTGVDLTAYGAEAGGGSALGALVRRLLAEIPELPRLRLSSLDPAEIDRDLWDVLATEPRLMPHLHFSLQAGSDLILKRMKRRHSRAQAAAAIGRARALRPGLAIGADLIAGFPTETEALFTETLAFVEEQAIPLLHVFPYSARPGTPAARMPEVAVPFRRERAERLRAAGQANARAYFTSFMGRRVSVLAENAARGRTAEYVPAVLTPAPSPGALVSGRVVRADQNGLSVAL